MSFIFLKKADSAKILNEAQYGNAPAISDNSLSTIKFFRSDNIGLTRPLLMTETIETPPLLMDLRGDLENEINSNISLGNISRASVFLRRIDEAGALLINGEDHYNPGSMMKIPIMMTCLKECMKYKSILATKILFEAPNKALPNEEGSVSLLSAGKMYTVKELIEFMIIYSDNDAMGLLYNFLGQEKLDKIFSDLGITVPPKSAPSFEMNPVEFSRFMLVLYNSTYLDAKNSEWALATLCKTKYKKSITRHLPETLPVAHKYGVAFDGLNKILSESAIVYLADQPYILVVMTRGNDYEKQSDLISNISERVYKSLAN